MAKRWQKEEITYLKRYAGKRKLEELAARYQIEAGAVESKLNELGLTTADGRGRIDLSDDPAVKLYERGLKAAHAGKWADAEKLFERVVAESGLSDVSERAEQYLSLSRRHLAKPEASGDLYTEALVLHNEGDLEAAEAICLKGGRLEQDERFAYLGAAIAARRGEHELAAERLETAIRLNPRNRIQASEDLDFAAMREESEFAELLS